MLLEQAVDEAGSVIVVEAKVLVECDQSTQTDARADCLTTCPFTGVSFIVVNPLNAFIGSAHLKWKRVSRGLKASFMFRIGKSLDSNDFVALSRKKEWYTEPIICEGPDVILSSVMIMESDKGVQTVSKAQVCEIRNGITVLVLPSLSSLGSRTEWGSEDGPLVLIQGSVPDVNNDISLPLLFRTDRPFDQTVYSFENKSKASKGRYAVSRFFDVFPVEEDDLESIKTSIAKMVRSDPPDTFSYCFDEYNSRYIFCLSGMGKIGKSVLELITSVGPFQASYLPPHEVARFTFIPDQLTT